MSILKCIIFIFNCLLYVQFGESLILDGEISTAKEDWRFVARFCFRKSLAKMTFHFEYPEEYCCQNILLYFDNQWKRVYPAYNKNCSSREGVLVAEYNQKIKLTPSYIHSGCHRVTANENNKPVTYNYNCGGRRSFVSIRARWWYIAVSNCKTTKGLKMRYHMELTNGESFWSRHFSADEMYILETDIAFLIAFFVLLFLALVEANILASRKLFHYTYKLFLWSIFCELVSLVFYVSYYTDYGVGGMPTLWLKVFGQVAHYIGHILFLIMLILLAKGWTVTRGRISSSGQVKLAVFTTLYSISFAILFIYERVIFDPGKVLYIYESPAGIGICILRIFGWLWFCYATFFTLKHFPRKTSFYYPFWFIYTGWFLVGPTVVLFAAYVIEDYQREQIVNGIEWSVSLISCVFFMMLTRPSAANTNFPFHMRTCQIGVTQPDGDNDISCYAYAPNDYVGAFTTHTFSMFQTSGPKRSETREPNNMYSNSSQNTMEYPMRTLSWTEGQRQLPVPSAPQIS